MASPGFNESEHPRGRGGEFSRKHHSESDVTLDNGLADDAVSFVGPNGEVAWSSDDPSTFRGRELWKGVGPDPEPGDGDPSRLNTVGEGVTMTSTTGDKTVWTLARIASSPDGNASRSWLVSRPDGLPLCHVDSPGTTEGGISKWHHTLEPMPENRDVHTVVVTDRRADAVRSIRNGSMLMDQMDEGESQYE